MNNEMEGRISSIGYIDDIEEVVTINVRFNRKEDREFFDWLMDKYKNSGVLRVKLEDSARTVLFG